MDLNWLSSAVVTSLLLLWSYACAQFPYDNIRFNNDSLNVLIGNYAGVSTLRRKLVNGNGVAHMTQDTGIFYCSHSWQ
jgi:hypothetical protein